ncbi:MAG TPA: peptide-methionine (S)-S-oxide reductase MsrA [Candidatus Nanoarchaeia archaeon]
MAKETATLAGGCFWCTEAIFKHLMGVEKVTSGYAGGKMENPSYDKVSQGSTGHAEAIQVEFNPKIITYEKLLEVFFKLHDPTTLNQQDADVGTQYRSAIFYHDKKQKEVAEKVKNQMQPLYKNRVATEIVPLTHFYPAEEIHQDYYAKNPSSAYCQVVIDPKIKKLLTEFKESVKD